MQFLNIMSELINSSPAKGSKHLENAVMLGLFETPPPIARHIIYAPLSNEKMQELVDSYELHFPTDLLRLYSKINGANLFWTTIYNDCLKRRFPLCHFSIYGYPETTRQRIEPYNISIEDLAHPEGTPDHWLKFGSYIPPIVPFSERYLYIDTQSAEIYALTGEETMHIMQSWNTLDLCLCDIYTQLNSAR